MAERLHVACPSGRSGQDNLVEPLQGENLGALRLDYFDLLASLALTVSCQSFYNACFH